MLECGEENGLLRTPDVMSMILVRYYWQYDLLGPSSKPNLSYANEPQYHFLYNGLFYIVHDDDNCPV